MRFIHIADLHLGKRVLEFSMIEDQRVMLDAVLSLCEEERPDALVIAGDVYDKTIPSIEAITLLENFLIRVSKLDIAVLLIAGNHDSGERLSFGGSFFKAHGLHVAGNFKGTVDKVSLEDEAGLVHFHLLPFIRPSDVRGYFPDIESVSDAVASALSTIDKSSGRHVLIAHQFVTAFGQDPLRSDSEVLQVGTVDAIDASIFDGFDYVALGHLHGRQKVGTGPIHYAGSPLYYSFSEVNQKKGALLVELTKDAPLIRQLPLQGRHEMRRIKGTMEALIEEGRSLEQRDCPSRLDYLEVTLTDEGPVADPMNRLKAVYPNTMHLLFQRGTLADDDRDTLLDEEDLANMQADELFVKFYKLQTKQELTDYQREIVKKVTAMSQEAVK